MVNEEDRTSQVKTVKYCAGTLAFFYAASNWTATQLTAAECQYSPLLGSNILHIYAPWKYHSWINDPTMVQAIPHILGAQQKWITIAMICAIIICYMITKGMKHNISHGSASWADAKDIKDAKLTATKSGVVVGINPFTNKLMLHDGPEHILLMAPTRSGKGVNTIIPTGLIWRESIFFFDVKGELWQATGSYRRQVLHQKVLKFAPLEDDGSSARWNPLAEIDFRTNREMSDVSTIVSMLVKPNGEKQGGGDPFWDNAASALLNGTIMHLLYAHYKEKKPLPCLTDVMSFLSSPDKSTELLFKQMQLYPHITVEEFLSDHNPLEETYGEYVRDFRYINEKYVKPLGEKPVRNLAELKEVIKRHGNVSFDEDAYIEEDDEVNEWLQEHPLRMLLVHPKVAESAANMVNNAEQTRASILSTAQTCLALYQNPVVQKNTEVSDFCIRDLLDPRQTVSLYLVMQVKDMATLKPLSRLFINTLLDKLIRDMKFDANGGATNKRRLLLLLDEFPQLGCLKKVELALAVCAGYGIKMCIVSQDVNQLNKEYTKDNSIASNCHIHIYFTPNLDSSGATAKAISGNLGKKTITTINHSDGGGIFKGSNSASQTGRELMTPDEVAKMSDKKEIVFVAGHRPILGDKLRYYEKDFFNTKILKPYPKYSDTCTTIMSYDDLFKVHQADALELKERKVEVTKEKSQLKLRDARLEAKNAADEVKAAEEHKKSIEQENAGKPALIARDDNLAVADSLLLKAQNVKELADAEVLKCLADEKVLETTFALNEAEDVFQAAKGQPFREVKAQQERDTAQKDFDEAKKGQSEVYFKIQNITELNTAYNTLAEAAARVAAVHQAGDKLKSELEIIQENKTAIDQLAKDSQEYERFIKTETAAQKALDVNQELAQSAVETFETAKNDISIIRQRVDKRKAERKAVENEEFESLDENVEE